MFSDDINDMDFTTSFVEWRGVQIVSSKIAI